MPSTPPLQLDPEWQTQGSSKAQGDRTPEGAGARDSSSCVCSPSGWQAMVIRTGRTR